MDDHSNSNSDADASFLQQEIERLQANNEAIRSEFEGSDVDTSPESIRKLAIEKAADALARIDKQGQFGESENVRLAANKFLVEIALGNKLPAGTSDDASVANLLRQLAKNDATKES